MTIELKLKQILDIYQYSWVTLQLDIHSNIKQKVYLNLCKRSVSTHEYLWAGFAAE